MSEDLLNEQQAAGDNPQQPLRRGPGRPPKTAEPEAPVGAAVSETITYVPGEGDPATVKWGNIVFEANKPQTINGHTGDPLKKECTKQERLNADIIERARKNKFFRVGTFDMRRDGVKVEIPEGPQNAAQYRAHAAAWLPTVTSVDELDKKWISEERLRRECEVGGDDIDYLMSLFTPVRSVMEKREVPMRRM
jgi:hypothetical protein